MAGVQQPYSTLEVAPDRAPELYETQKQVVPNQDASKYQDASQYPDASQYQDASQYPETVPNTGAFGQQQYPSGVPQQTTAQHTGRRTRWIVVGVLVGLLALGAILGGVLGTQLHHGSSSSSSSSSPANSTNSTTPGSNVNVLANSRLAANNYTDSQNINHRTIFFQDAFSNLIALRWDSKTTDWLTVNISEKMSNSIGLKLAPGSPIATAATDGSVEVHEVRIWYLDNSYQVQCVWWNWDDEDNVTFDSNILNAKLVARPGSSLAATWQRPGENDTSSGLWHIVYQSTNGDVKETSPSNWASPNTAVSGSSVDTNSSLTIIPTLDNYWASSMTLMLQTNGDAVTSSWNGSWDASRKYSSPTHRSLPCDAMRCDACDDR